jgi:hypothetical protein
MADAPKKTRAERKAELARLWTTPGGRAQVIALYLEATGRAKATVPNSSSLVFKTILDKEFPHVAWPGGYEKKEKLPRRSTMKFVATFARDDTHLPVSGEVLPTALGRRGKFNFSIADAPTIAPGPAQLITDAGETWQIMVLNTTVPGGEEHGECEFRFRGEGSGVQKIRKQDFE